MDIQKIFPALGVCLVLITTFGIFGNILSLYIWTKGQRCSKRQGAIYLCLLALADILVLCVPVLELTVLLLTNDIFLRHLHPILCKIFPISPYFCVQLSTWIVVTLTVEQTVAVCRPFQMRTSASKLRQYGIVTVVAIAAFLDNVPILVAANWEVEEYPMNVNNETNDLNKNSLSIVWSTGA